MASPITGAIATPLDRTQRAWVAVAKSAAIALRATTGYLTIGYVGGASPFEQLIGRDWLDGLAESDRLVPDDALLRRER
jgi:hypothetical protein